MQITMLYLRAVHKLEQFLKDFPDFLREVGPSIARADVVDSGLQRRYEREEGVEVVEGEELLGRLDEACDKRLLLFHVMHTDDLGFHKRVLGVVSVKYPS